MSAEDVMATGGGNATQWLKRVIHNGRLGISEPPAWLREAYDTFHRNVTHPAYPCFFGTLAERRGEMFYSYVSRGDVAHLPRTMLQFIELSQQQENEKNNLAVFFEPAGVDFDHEQFRSFCWQTLQFLADSDCHVSADSMLEPSDAAWEFSFGGMQMFVVGCSPTYRLRRSRNLGKGIVLLFQPRSVFIDAMTNREISLDARSQVRRRLLAWDGVPAHPDLGMFGDPQNREWKQYFLPDDTNPETGVCPFHAKRPGAVAVEPSLVRPPNGLVAQVRHWAMHAPDRIAVRFLADGMGEELCLSFGELDARSRTLAQRMLTHATPGERALLLLPSGPDFIAAFLACLYAQIIAVPAFPRGTNAKYATRVDAIVADCGPKLILAESVDDVSAIVVPGRTVIDVSQVMAGVTTWVPTPGSADDVAFLQYTSGSTAAPKGVMVTHRNLDENLQVIGRAFRLSQADVMANWLPLYHDMGLIGGVLLPLYFGFPLVLLTPQHFLASPVRWLRAVSRYGVTVSGAPDFAYQLCLDRIAPQRLDGIDLSTWRVAWCGAEPIRLRTVQAFVERFRGRGLREDALHPCYGLAEATLMVSGQFATQGVRYAHLDPVKLAGGWIVQWQQGTPLIDCGSAPDGHVIRIVDPNTGRSCADDRVGEVWFAGASVAAGYWRRPAETAQTFGAILPDCAEQRFLRTGDLGCIVDGKLFICGRLKDLIIVRGQNIYPQDVEQSIGDHVEGVRRGRIAAFPVVLDDEEGIGVAAEITRTTSEADRASVIRGIRRAVIDSHGEPVSVVLLLHPGTLPRTSSGKLQRSVCASAWNDGSLDPVAVFRRDRMEPEAICDTAAPTVLHDVTEQRLAAIWRDVLGVSSIARSSDFLELGGQSIALGQVAARIMDMFGIELPLQLLFEARTIEAQAKLVAATAKNVQPPSVPRWNTADRANLPLMPGQEGLWYLWKLEPASSAYTIALSLRLAGPLSAQRLRAAIDGVISRHEALRARFVDQAGVVRQAIVRSDEAVWSQHDLSAETDPDAAAERCVRAASVAPFDLEHGPLLRATLLRLHAEQHILSLSVHHIVSDGWSIGVLLREIAALYNGASLPNLPWQYGDHVTWRHARLNDQVLNNQLVYWQRRLGEEHPALILPTDRPRRQRRSGVSGRVIRTLPAALQERMQALALAHGVTLPMLLLTAFAILLYRNTGQRDLRIAVPVSSRDRLETESLIGFFVNTLVIRIEMSGAMSVAAALAQVRTRMLEARAHQDVPFERLVEALQPERVPGQNPLAQVKFAMQEDWGRFDRLGDARCVAVEQIDVDARFDLALDVVTRPDRLTCEFIYAADLFDDSTVGRLAAELVTILDAMCANPQEGIGAMELADGRIGPDRGPDGPHLLLHVARHAASMPQQVALVSGDQTLTWQALWSWSGRLAARLSELGITNEDRVAVVLPRGFALVASILAVWRAGAAYVPLDPEAPADRLAWYLADCGARCLICDDQAAPAAGIMCIAPQEGGFTPLSMSSPYGKQAAYVIYTSGSTGRPKGVVVSHDALMSYLDALAEKLPASIASAAYVSTPAADLGHTVLFGALQAGWTLHLLTREQVGDPDSFSTYMASHAVDLLKIVPSHLAALLHAARPADALPRRCLILGGEATSAVLAARISALNPECVVLNHYGPTETTVGVTVRPGTDTVRDLLPLGHALSNSVVRVLDVDGNRVSLGVVGEICVGGSGLARGYLDRGGLTAERFVPDPFGEPGTRLYRTGDRARELSNGELEFLGRLDDQVKIRGYRVEPEEVASALRSLPGVVAATVIARPDDQGHQRLLGYVTGDVDVAVLMQTLAARLPAYMVPSAIIAMAALPVTANGKIDRRALPASDAPSGASAAPRTDAERKLLDIWRRVLKNAHIGITDNFFALGGDSIRSLQIIAQARRAGLRLTPAQVLEGGTVERLARLAEPISGVEDNPAAISVDRPLPDNGLLMSAGYNNTDIQDVYPATATQAGLLFHTGSGDAGVYVGQLRLTVRGALNMALLRDVWSAAVVRHDVLRTCFVWTRTFELMQVVAYHADLILDEFDWSSETTYEQRLTEWLAADAAHGVDPVRAPLMRVALFHRPDGDHDLVWTTHHAITDGWSSARIVSEVLTDYRARANGERAAFPSTARYRDYVAWLQRQPDVSDWWRARVDQYGDARLLADALGSDMRHETGFSRRTQQFDEGLTGRLRHASQRFQVTLHTLFQAAWAIVLARLGGQSCVVFGTTIAGRPEDLAGVETATGLFINSLPMHVEVTGAQRLEQWLLGLQALNSELWEHGHAALADIQRWTGSSGKALFDSLLVFENVPVDAGIDGKGSALELVSFEASTRTHYPLTLTVFPDSTIEAHWDWDRSRFDDSQVGRVIELYACALWSLCSDAPAYVGDICLPVVGEWDRGVVVHPFCDVVSRVHGGALAGGEASAVVCGAERVSHAALWAWSSRIGWRLHGLGVAADMCVGLCVERSAGLVAGLLGIWRSGGAFVPLDPTYPAARLREMIEDAGVGVVVADAASARRLSAVLSGCTVVDVGGEGEEPPAGWREALDGRQLAYVIYTSGSTGRPKGVAISHGALSLHLDDFIATYAISAADTVLQFTTVSFDAFIDQALPALTQGGRVVMRGADAWDLETLTRTLSDEAVSIADLPTAYWQQWVHRLPASLPSLRQVTVGGEALAGDALRRWQQGPLRHIRLDNLYGPTETTIAVLYRQTQAEDGDAVIVPIGVPYPARTAYVVDADGNEVPVGGVGELCIGGASLARGYLGRGGLTAERFVPDRWGGAGGRLYRTGDVCRRRGDGTVEFLGRQDQQVKLRGQRIEPGEVEAALRAERGVRDAVALVRGEGEARRLVAYVAGEADGSALKGALVRRLPGYLVPSVVMVLEALPVMANGKLDRAALPEPAAAEPRAMVAARTAAEAALLGVWRSVLGRDDLGVTENFFEVGGDSILSLQIIARAREAGWHLTPRQVFEQPTIEAAARVAERLPEVAATAAEASGPLVLTPIQAGFFARHPQGQAHWNQSVLLTVRGVLDVAALRRVLSALVARHEALRLRFRRDAGGAWQPGIAAAETSELLEVQELSDAPDWAARLAAGGTRLQRSLDLAHGPLLRALYARLAGGEGRLLLTVHHLAVDGVSWRVLLAELQTGLAQAERGEAIALAGEGTPWGEWARRLAAYAGRAEVAAELGWWQAMLAGVDGSLPAVAVAERRPGERYLGERYLGERYLGESRTVEWRLDREQTRRLLREVPRAYRTRVDEVLLAALARVLGAWCGRSEVLVELEGHGREDVLAGVELSRTVGWFTTTYPVVLPVAAEAAATLVGVKERLREVPANGLHYGLLAHLGDAATRSALAGLARPWVSFNYLGQFDQSLEAGGRFGFATEAAGASMDPASPLDCALELNGLVAGGELSLSWRYVPGELADETVEGLAAAFGAELAGLIAHCAAAPAGATASDFPLSGLTQAELAGLGLALGEVEDLYPATPVQQGLLFHSLLEPGSGVYVNQLRLTLSGKLDASALRAAWQSAVSRHAVLRTGFVWRHGGEPLQVVQRSVALPWTEQDWSGEGDYEAALAAWRAADVARGFELSQAPLLRLALFRRPDGAHDLLWTTHHLLLDGWSAARLLEQVEQDYQALVSGRPARPVAVARYRDYVAWLQAQPGAEAWWRERLAALDEPAMLGDALERPAAAEAGVQRLTHRLDEVASARLRAAAQRHQVTLNTLMQAAFALLLARCSGRAEVVFGATVAGRPAALPGVERMVGLFINSLPVWVKVPAALPVSAWLAALQAQASELRQYEHTRLADVQAWAGRPGEPLFDALMVFENYPVEALSSLDATGLAVSRAEMVERSHYPLTVTISPGAAVEIEWAWDGAAFARAAMQRLLAGYAAILAQMAEAGGAEAGGAEADRAVGSIGLTVAPAAARPLPGYRFRPVAERIAERAVLAPAAVAVGCGEAVLDRAGLEAWSNRIAQRLRRLGVASEERVGLCVERSAGMVAGLLGILKSGAAYVPLDPAYPVERLRLMLDDAAVRCVVSDAASAAALGDGPAGLQRVMITEVAAEPAVAPPVRVQPDQLAYVIYTSGSTGRPKGVGVSHAALDRFLASMAVRPGLDASDVWLSVTSPSFDIAALELYLPLLAGARVEIAPREAVTDGQRLAGLVEQCGATVLQATPSGWRLLLEGGWPGRALKGLCGGEALAADLAAALQRRGVELWNMYGPTETTIWSSLASLPAASEVSLGEAIHDTTLHLLDEAGQAVPEGGCGELCIGGANLARGYLNRPGLTAASFVPDPFGPAGVRLYRTGDLCRRRDDGTLVFLGRRDQQVKLRGHRIELGEIEAALRAQPGVRDAVAILHGPGDARRIVAYAATEQDPAALAHAIAPLLPPPARPSTIITLQAIPTTPNGKRDRSRLPHPTTQPRPYIPPQSHTETMLAHIWARVLERDNISRTDNFFEIGGDSLRALRVATLARNAGLPWVTPAALFTHSVLAALANDARPSGHAQNVAVMNRQGSQRTLFCIHPGYGLVSEYRALAQELDGCVTVYGVESPIYADPDWRACDLDDLARHYVDCVRQVQPDGPYSLLGWSHGGLVAVAMAHRFRRDGHAVQFVGLVDVAADIPEEPVSATPDDDQADIVDLLREIGDPRWQAADLLTHDAEIVRQAVAVIRHQDALVRGYRIPRLDVPLTVWWAGQSLPRPAAQLDWRRHTTAGVCAEGQIDTDHKTIIRHPAFLASVRHELLRSG